jgi:predicted O-methyltransferase YrrM
MKNKINKFLGESRLNVIILNSFPRHSVRFAKNHFKNKKITAVEIGTYQGFNAENMLKILDIEKIYLIDPYEEYDDYLKSEKKQTQKALSKVEREARKRLKNYRNKIVWIKEYSNEAIKDVPIVDFIYIDGNHEYGYVKKDMENYWKKVKKGGILAGHDIASFPGVGEALIEFCYENRLKPIITRTDWWIVKE